METEEQALPPNPELLNRQPKWFKPVLYLCIGASVLFILAILLAPFTLRSRKKSDQTEAVSNARQIGLGLFEFEQKYGTFPSPTTTSDVTTSNPTHTFNLSGTSSNALLRQLFAAQLTQSEAMFYAKTKDTRRPDGIITPGEALKRGEVGFSYISGLSTKDDPAAPIVLTPLIPGTIKFDPKPFKGFAVVLRIDNSVCSYKIAKDGHIYDSTGINLLSPKHPVWKGKAPDIRYPE